MSGSTPRTPSSEDRALVERYLDLIDTPIDTPETAQERAHVHGELLARARSVGARLKHWTDLVKAERNRGTP